MAYTKDIGINDFYKAYRVSCKEKNKKPVTYKMFTDVIKAYNLKLRNKIVYESERVKLPYRLGELYIVKYENLFDLEKKNKWKVDFKASKEAGYRIYHENKYGYRWLWFKKTCIVSGKRYFQFKPARLASRAIADAIKNKKIDYYN
jgi:hypothetical protein